MPVRQDPQDRIEHSRLNTTSKLTGRGHARSFNDHVMITPSIPPSRYLHHNKDGW
jgi:hypothetical protein